MKKTFYCINPSCKKLVARCPGEIEPSGKVFCSNSCANKKCNKEIKRDRKYCSTKCQWVVNSVTDEEYKEIIIDKIKEFYKTKGRIPFKQEMWRMYHASRKIFGSWNNAIIASGFKPNPVKFANKYIANDGHKCDSLAEKIIDDWLCSKKIKHKTKISYNYHRMTADFKIGNTYVEFFGLQGEVESYDRLIKEKEQLWKERNLEVIKIYPKDLFPKNKLDQIFAKITV